MATIISWRRLQPGRFDDWLARFAAGAPARIAAGCNGARRFQCTDKPDEVIVIFDWDSHERAKAFIEANQVAMRARDPAAPPPLIETYYVEELQPLAG